MQVFSCEFCEIFRTAIFAEHLRMAAFERITKDSFFFLKVKYFNVFVSCLSLDHIRQGEGGSQTGHQY